MRNPLGRGGFCIDSSDRILLEREGEAMLDRDGHLVPRKFLWGMGGTWLTRRGHGELHVESKSKL